MAFHIDGVDYIPKGRWPKDGERSNQLILIRLLIGLIHIENGKEKVNQDINFSVVPPCPQTNKPGEGFKEFSGKYSLGVSLPKLISSTVSVNRLFFQDLLGEFSNYFFQTKRSAHTAAFVFLYRALERISYSVPLLYNSKSNDFFGTFNDMKALFSKDKDGTGELGLFKKFLNQGKFIDPVILDTAYKIQFNSHAGYDSKYFDVLTRLYTGFSSLDPTTSTIEIKFRDIPDLLVPLRNRFFHFRTGDAQKNIAIRDIHDSDEFFSAVNYVFCSFLAVVSLHAIAATCNK
jgi:hypothetical protein